MKKCKALAIAFALSLSFASGGAWSADTPNVVLIFADDLGYGDLGCYGATKVQTPNIDLLAAKGRRFTDAHSASAVCTPSRYGLLTGEYPLRAMGGKGVWGPLSTTTGLIIDTETLTIGKVFKNKGYATAAFGKWHLGFKQGKNDWQIPLRPGPQDVGFDQYFGVPLVNSGSPFVYVQDDTIVGHDPADPLVYGGKPISPTPTFPAEASRKSPNRFGGALRAHQIYDDEKTGTLLTEKAVNWITEKKDEPFFLYFPTPNIHHPFTPAPRFKGTSQCGLYGDFVHELDWMVGEILQCLDDNGLSDNTLVIFTSDNGGMMNLAGRNAVKEGHKINGDLLRFKFGVWEGGHRVPFIARWPGKIKPGTQSDQLISQIDLLATFTALTDQDPQTLNGKDSINMLPAWLDDPKEPLRTELVLAPARQRNLAIRKGKWVYIGAKGSGGFNGSKPSDHAWGGPAAVALVGGVNSDIFNGKIKPSAPSAQLYDLETDVNQTNNLYDSYPEVVKELSALLATYAPPKTEKKPSSRTQNGKGKPAKKIPAAPSNRETSLDFESGNLAPWRVIEGKFGHPIASRDRFINKDSDYNKQGRYFLSTLEISADAERGSDDQTGVIVSPQFIPKPGSMTFRVGGGKGQDTYVALCLADGTELKKARGIGAEVMQEVSWDLTPYAGKKVFLKVVDQSTSGWGHITADHFEFDGKIQGDVDTQSSDAKPVEAASDKKPSVSVIEEPTAKPNFVLIFTDDQGYADLSCFGGKHVSTPNIDQMAAEGTKLTSFYVAAPLCTPSRAALMTGCYPKRIDMAYGSDFAVLLAADKKGLNPEEVTIAEVLKSAGYKTGMFGKWHLGDQPEFLPTRQGFDEFFGIPYSHDIHPQHPRQQHFKFPPLPLLENETVVEMDPDADYLTRRITENAVKFIDANKDAPFFLYVPHPIPHSPLHVSPPFMADAPDATRAKLETEQGVNYGLRNKQLFRPAISEIDWSVGQILDALKKNGIEENTLVMFTSDNGPSGGSGGKATPLRGRKGTTFEGGMREPTVIRWTGKIPAGQVNDEMMTAMDLLPTFANLAGAEIPADRMIDGKDIWSTIVGKSSTPHEAFFYYRDNSLNAVRSGKWKLHLKDGKPNQLCDLENDIGEKENLIKSQPQVAQRLIQYVNSFQDDLASNSRPAAFVENPTALSK